ncbi:MAG: response regulator transcription factor [Pontiellaceae bacterium]|nr:response regulator transcription factor [Pontiellaceae bacterium]MBN2786426.1 response regulator transcription factor [Pontiellaceae bacterium]
MIKVGIVEDNRTLREGFAMLIDRSPNMKCICSCMTVAEALQEIPKAKPDVVLMDIQLPDGTGIECTAKIKEQLPALQIVVVTVYEDSDRIFHALQAGACGYLLKRAGPERIVAAIQEAHDGDVPMTPEIARKVIGQFRDQARTASEVENLTPRENEVLQYVMHGLTNKEIADRMGVSVAAIKWHLQHIYEKLHVHSRTEAALKYKEQQPE